MRLAKFDFLLSFAVWLGSLGFVGWAALHAAEWWRPELAVVVVATTANLLHQRHLDWWQGWQFENRVRHALAEQLALWEERVKAVEHSAKTNRETLNNMNIALKGTPNIGYMQR